MLKSAVISEEAKRQVLDAMALLPDGDGLCHGDLHPDNVMITGEGPIIIDWCLAARGNPLADVANTLVLLRYGVPESNRISPLLRLGMRWGRTWFRHLYLQYYLGSAPPPYPARKLTAGNYPPSQLK